ncbi:hypothetical protein F4778DRAFT_763613 [Xylariomycetidae sp. FL2044]|nr:hypothetical protein F4778DRAFT_763613 [Xylariomycetidae sp. FL2044]
MSNTSFLEFPPSPSSRGENLKETRNVLIYFIPGNPGLIDYYAPFLSTLSDLLNASSGPESPRFHIFGQNLSGFSDLDHEPFTPDRKPFSLEHQIQNTLVNLEGVCAESRRREGHPYDAVVLIGHSVGSYIALELFQRLLRKPDLAPDVKLGSGILLFPTIDHIARSPSGRKLDLLRRTPVLGDNAYRIAQGFLRLWPRSALYWVVHRVMRFPAHAAEVTTDWLKSRDGLWQTLHMGMDEMRTIDEDKWDDELWEIAHEAEMHDKPVPKFFFFFGKDDHWVADHFRDEFIRKRQKQPERTRFFVDEGNIPHAFCIHHSETIAEKVHLWITEVYAL